MARKYLPPTPVPKGGAKGIHVPGPDESPAKVEKPAKVKDEKSEAESPDAAVEVPAESVNRPVLEEFAVKHAGITEDDAKAFANKGELYAAILAALETSDDGDDSGDDSPAGDDTSE